MRNVSRLGLEQKEQIAVFLRLFVVGEESFLQFSSLVKMASDLVLLYTKSIPAKCNKCRGTSTSSNAMRFWMSRAIRESR